MLITRLPQHQSLRAFDDLRAIFRAREVCRPLGALGLQGQRQLPGVFEIPQLAIGAIIRSVSAQTSASTLPGEKPARPRSKFDVKLHC